MAELKIGYYPKLEIKNNEHPNKFLSFPFIGILVRVILLLPVFFVSIFYSLWYFVLWLVVPFAILFTKKYPDTIYNFFIGFLKFYTKMSLYLFSLSDKYPGFGLDTNGMFELHYEKPKKPSLLFSFPIIGIIIRLILLIPYFIYESVLQYGTQWSVFFSWFAILFKGKYPESLYEFNRDFLRVAIAETMYTSYLSDDYPSFKISMNHKNVKILLIVLGALSMFNGSINRSYTPPTDNYNYNNYQDSSNDTYNP